MNYGAGNYTSFSNINATKDGNCILVGCIKKEENTKEYMLKVDNEGEMIWEREYSWLDRTTFAENIIEIENAYLVCGGVYNQDDSYYDILLLKTDNYGNVLTVNPSVEEKGALFYPNPAEDKIIYDYPLEGEITLYNNNGCIIFCQKNPAEKSIDVSGLRNGIYIIEYTDKNGVKYSEK